MRDHLTPNPATTAATFLAVPAVGVVLQLCLQSHGKLPPHLAFPTTNPGLNPILARAPHLQLTPVCQLLHADPGPLQQQKPVATIKITTATVTATTTTTANALDQN